MLIGIIQEKNYDAVLVQLNELAHDISIVEWRLDFLEKIHYPKIQAILAACKLPMILTIRTEKQGGFFQNKDETIAAILLKLASLSPAYLDVEYHFPLSVAENIKQKHPSVQLIASYHNHENTPENLSDLLMAMKNPCIDVCKIITRAHSALDGLRVLKFIQIYSKKYRLVSHAMGEVGQFTRILGKIVGNCFTYASLKNEKLLAPGLLTVHDLIAIYHYPTLNFETKIYALMGDPVDQSPGHFYHNQYYLQKKINAVYVKITVKREELNCFMKAVKSLPFYGFSVTMPLKEAITEWVDMENDIVKKTQACNTLKSNKEKFIGINTDYLAAFQLFLQEKTKNKRCLIVGFGGAARAIIVAAIDAGMNVYVVSHHIKKIEHCYSAQTLCYEDLYQEKSFDWIISTVPTIAYKTAEIKNAVWSLLKAHAIVIDIAYGTPTPLIQQAKNSECFVIDAKYFYELQADKQLHYWFEESANTVCIH